jgi:hypothetical protein
MRVCFDASEGYERRMTYAERLGTAFHLTLQSLTRDPMSDESTSAIAEEVRRRFHRELKIQEDESSLRPREQSLPRDGGRKAKAEEAIVSEALRMPRPKPASPGQARYRHNPVSREPVPQEEASTSQGVSPSHINDVEVEVPVTTGDGLIVGRIDRAEHRDDGTWLFDYKSAMREDLPERYQRQIQLYAFMWHETRHEWPVEAQVLYPLAATARRVSIVPDECSVVAEDSIRVIRKIERTRRATDLATPGEVCKVCEYRPWCSAFWNWQEKEPPGVLSLERAEVGFEGQVKTVRSSNCYWKLEVAWKDALVTALAPEERLPHLRAAREGMIARVLDTRITGLRHKPRAVITDYSEIFIVQA